MTVTLAKIHERYAHGQHVIYYPQWIKDEYGDDVDKLAEWGEEMIIDEVIDSSLIVLRPLGSDATFTVHPDRVSSPFGTPCKCRDESDAWPCY